MEPTVAPPPPVEPPAPVTTPAMDPPPMDAALDSPSHAKEAQKWHLQAYLEVQSHDLSFKHGRTRNRQASSY